MAVTEASLRDELKTAMRAKEQVRTKVVRNLLAAIKNRNIETRAEAISDADLLAILKRESKQCRETLDAARDAGRDEMVAEHEEVLAILGSYLPQQLSEAELEEAVKAIVAETGADSIGPVMKGLAERHPGGYDGKLASKVAAKVLNS
jgi:uncharacterized protein YqeY